MSEQTSSTADHVGAREAMRDYLEQRLAQQLTAFSEVKQRIAVLLTIYGVLLALVGAGLPTLRTQAASPVLVKFALVLVGLFGLSLAATLLVVVMKLHVELELPGVERGSFQNATQSNQLVYTNTLDQIVTNLAEAVDKNVQRLENRRASSWKFQTLNYVTLGLALLALASCSLVYVTTTPAAGATGEKQMTEQTKPASQASQTAPQPTSQTAPQATSQAAPQPAPSAAQSTPSAAGAGQQGATPPAIQVAPPQPPSILAKPQTIALGEGVDPARSSQSVHLTTEFLKSGNADGSDGK